MRLDWGAVILQAWISSCDSGDNVFLNTEWSPGQGDFANGLMDLLIDLRKEARANKDFATADQIRDALKDAGVTLEDRAGGTEWTVA